MTDWDNLAPYHYKYLPALSTYHRIRLPLCHLAVQVDADAMDSFASQSQFLYAQNRVLQSIRKISFRL